MDLSSERPGGESLHQDSLPRLYRDLASWFPILTAPEDYAEEAAIYRKTMVGSGTSPLKTLLEFGSGGGNNASHLKAHFMMTLVDLSADMLAVSRSLNPECEHIQGDMRTVRLERLFDAVFIHDAIVFMTTENDLRSAIETAFVHCRPGGVALFCPDHVRETFRPSTSHGGHDVGKRSLRYLQWSLDPDPADTTYVTHFVYLLREDGEVRCENEQDISGLFAREQWLRFMTEAGFQARSVPFEHSEIEPGTGEFFLGLKPQ